MRVNQEPSSEELIQRINTRDSWLRGIGVLWMVALTVFTIIMLFQVNATQEQIRTQGADQRTRQTQLIQQSEKNSQENHAETIRYLRCIALLNPPYQASATQLDECIRTSKLPDGQQDPPISATNSTQSNALNRSSNNQAPSSAPAQEAPRSSGAAQQQPAAPAQQPTLIESLLKGIGL